VTATAWAKFMSLFGPDVFAEKKFEACSMQL
jgi:hypothetical protein